MKIKKIINIGICLYFINFEILLKSLKKFNLIICILILFKLKNGLCYRRKE